MPEAMTASDMKPASREQLLHWLAEAAELEHNLLCSYLFALFSLKTSTEEGLSSTELEAVSRWRRTLLSVCIQETAHLAQVANLMASLGSRPHFGRPNLPIAPSYHPASIVVELTPFDRDTLDHMVHLERPEGANDPDGASFVARRADLPRAKGLTLMPSGRDYGTIGQPYDIPA